MSRFPINLNFTKKTETPQSPTSTPRTGEKHHSRQRSLMSPRDIFGKKKVAAENPSAVWTASHMQKAQDIIIRLSEGKDVWKETSKLLKKTGGLEGQLKDFMVKNVKDLPDEKRNAVCSRAYEMAGKGLADARTLFEAIAAADVPQVPFDEACQLAVKNLMAAKDQEEFLACCRVMEKLVEQGKQKYGKDDAPLYLVLWTKSLADCPKERQLTLFDQFAAEMVQGEGISSEVVTVIQDAVVPKIISEVAEDILHAALHGLRTDATDTRFLALAHLCPKMNDLAIDEALSSGGYSKPQMATMLENLRLRQAGVNSALKGKIEARSNCWSGGVKSMEALFKAGNDAAKEQAIGDLLGFFQKNNNDVRSLGRWIDQVAADFDDDVLIEAFQRLSDRSKDASEELRVLTQATLGAIGRHLMARELVATLVAKGDVAAVVSRLNDPATLRSNEFKPTLAAAIRRLSDNRQKEQDLDKAVSSLSNDLLANDTIEAEARGVVRSVRTAMKKNNPTIPWL